jgi:hypothetical protein
MLTYGPARGSCHKPAFDRQPAQAGRRAANALPSIAWAGQPLTGVAIEISVKSDALTADEQKALLR